MIRFLLSLAGADDRRAYLSLSSLGFLVSIVAGYLIGRKVARMVYKVPKSKASIKQNQFEFEIEGKTYSVPLLKFIKGSTVEEMAALERAGGMQAAAANYVMFGPADTPVGRAIRTLDQEQLNELAQAWAEASGVSVGESVAS